MSKDIAVRKRVGLVGKKVGMSALFAADGKRIPVTLVKIESSTVLGVRTHDKHGYNAVQIATGSRRITRIHKPIRSLLAKAGIQSAAYIKEFRVSSDALLDIGATIGLHHFVVGQHVDVQGTSIGRGFAGAMKRHGFGGLRATHGVSVSHRSHGSTGACQDPGRVWKGKKMAGHFGNETITLQNLQIVSIDESLGIIAIKGCVPGSKGGILYLSDALKRALPAAAPYPAGIVTTQPQASDATNDHEPIANETQDA